MRTLVNLTNQWRTAFRILLNKKSVARKWLASYYLILLLRIDGANDLVILFRIVIPLSLPAMLFIREKSRYPLQLVLREILLISSANNAESGDSGGVNNLYETIKYSLIIVGTVPILFIYPFLQRFFVKGALIGAVKR